MPIPADLARLFGLEADQPPVREALDLVLVPGGGNAPELCQLAGVWREERHPRNAIAQLKADGIRCLYVGGLLVTREGQPFRAASHAMRGLRELEAAFGRPMFFDAEYTNEDGLEAAIADFRRGHGSGTVWVFDAVPLDQWQANRCTIPLRRRLEMLERNGANCFGPAVGMLKGMRLDLDGTIAKAHELWALDFEGLVVKNADGLYDRQRSDDWQKLKRREHTDVRVMDCLTAGERADKRLRGILVSHNGRTQKITAGFGAAERVAYAAGDYEVTGRLARIEHAGLTGGGMLRDARFIELLGRI